VGLFAAADFERAYHLSQVVTLDVGGTTSKVGIIQDGRVAMTNDSDILGIPINAPTALIHSIALGGGSVVSIDPTSHQLHLGPESMGAYPGPACYDLGGTEPTLTDALLTLNWLPADYLLGGSRKLNTERAREVIEQHVAKPLDKSVEQAALDIASAAFQMVADTVRDVLGRVDWRPEESTLFTFGGNGPAFACGVAERVGISQAYIFDLGAVFSAFGSSISDIAHVYEHGLNVSLTSSEGQRRVREVGVRFSGMVRLPSSVRVQARGDGHVIRFRAADTIVDIGPGAGEHGGEADGEQQHGGPHDQWSVASDTEDEQTPEHRPSCLLAS